VLHELDDEPLGDLLQVRGPHLDIRVWSTVLKGAPAREERGEVRPLLHRLRDVTVYVLPLGIIVFLVLGLIFLGVATPTESAALGAVGSLLLLLLYRRFKPSVLRVAFSATVSTTTMIFFIVVASMLYSQVMSFSGATSGLVRAITDMEASPLLVLLLLQAMVLFLGLFLDQASIMLVTLPLFMPIVADLGWNPVSFGILMLINLQIAGTTPPFGLNLFVMKGVAPKDTRMGDIYVSALPFIGSDLVIMVLVVVVPAIALWLPGLMS